MREDLDSYRKGGLDHPKQRTEVLSPKVKKKAKEL